MCIRDRISGGNFHGQPLAMAADQLAVALATLAGISERRIEQMTNPQTSLLPAFLVREAGLNSGFMLIQIAAAALASETKILAAPHSVDSIPTGANQEDYVSMGMAGARRLAAMLENLRNVLSMELLAACQGIDLLSPLRTGPRTQRADVYKRQTQQFPLAGAQLAQGIYDPYNAQYYFTDANQVQVFSLAQGSWLSPIPIPALAGTTQRLWGIALSPDGSHLAISDVMAGVIYTLNPSTPSTVSTYSIKSTNPAGIVTNPSGLAISDAGIVYFTVVVSGGDGFDSFFKLDTSTGTVTDYGITGPGGPLDSNLRIVIGSDNSRCLLYTSRCV